MSRKRFSDVLERHWPSTYSSPIATPDGTNRPPAPAARAWRSRQSSPHHGVNDVMRRNRWTHRPMYLLAAGLLALFTIAAMACSEPVESEGCEEDDDCPDGELCDTDANECVEAEEMTCDDHWECPGDRLCMDGLCVEEEDFVCETTADCPGGDVCSDGECVEDVIEDEHYNVTFTSEHQVDGDVELYLTNSDGEPNEPFDTGDIDCDAADQCVVTANESYLIVIEGDDGNQTASAAPLAGDPPEVDGDAQTFATEMDNPSVRGNGVTFKRPEDGDYRAYYQPIDGAEKQVATLHDTAGNQHRHRWNVFPEHNVAVQFQPPGLRDLDIRIGDMDAGLGVEDQIYQISGGAAHGEGLGSYMIRNVPSAISDDGRLVAFYVPTANQYEDCSSDDECSGPGAQCGQSNRCWALEPTVHVVDRDHVDQLGEGCSSHEECGPVNRCDSGSEDFEDGLCAPQRISMGLADVGLDACEETRSAGETEMFTDLSPPLNFAPDGTVYFVAERDCVRDDGDAQTEVEANIPRSVIVSGDPYTGEFTEVHGNLGGDDYNAADCGGFAERFDDSVECVKYIEQMRLSPDGNDFVYLGTDPGSGASRADSDMHVWRARRDADNFSRIGGVGTEVVDEFAPHYPASADDDDAENDDE